MPGQDPDNLVASLGVPERTAELIVRYLDGDLPEQDMPELRAALEQSASARDLFVQWNVQAQALAEALIPQYSETDESIPFEQLALMEAQAPAELVNLDQRSSQGTSPHENQPALTMHEVIGASRYLIRHSLASKFVIGGAIAAMLMFAFVLYLAFSGQGNAPQTPGLADKTVNEPSDPGLVGPALNKPVATITATHNAIWAEGAEAPGAQLRAGQRLTLAQGFAEITTTRGAVVILEAPVTIDLTHNANAIQLLAGKLVGICETADSKGFTVYTPKARVVDLGTRFGVEVHSDGSTTAAVFTGEVQLSEVSTSPDQPTRNIHLTQGWASSVSRTGLLHREPRPVTAKDYAQFAMSIEEAIDSAFAYHRAVLASKPVLYWGFEEQGSTTRNLAGDPAMNGKAFGQTARGDGLFGSALKLTGNLESMGGFASENPLSFAETKGYTLEAWCWVDRAHHGRVLALAELDDLGVERPKHYSAIEVLAGGERLQATDSQGESIRFLHRNPPSGITTMGVNTFSPQGVPVGQWFHLVAVNHGHKTRIYLDAELIAEADDDQPIATDRAIALYAGVSPIMLRADFSNNPTDFRPFHGRIDELAVYDRALSQETIRTHFSLGRVSQD